MSETLRDLVVSLSLNSDNFTRNIKSINKQIQEAESAFRLASAGVENFETTTAGLSSKLSALQRTFQLQQDAVGQYERALQQASDKLQECYRLNIYTQLQQPCGKAVTKGMEMNIRQANRFHEPGKAPLKRARLGSMGGRAENKFAGGASCHQILQLRQQKVRCRQYAVRTPGLGRTEYQQRFAPTFVATLRHPLGGASDGDGFLFPVDIRPF